MKLNDEWMGTRFPPNGYPFQDPRTGLKFDAMSGGLDDRVTQVIKHRRANPNIYPQTDPKYLDVDWVRLEIIDYICQQVPSNCNNGIVPKPVINVIELPTTPCPSCGQVSWSAAFCRTCGSGKISSYKCMNCGAKI
jgi:predicted RNA-binding Zn-ribbon protein involved in translation (DUF1610 family)